MLSSTLILTATPGSLLPQVDCRSFAVKLERPA